MPTCSAQLKSGLGIEQLGATARRSRLMMAGGCALSAQLSFVPPGRRNLVFETVGTIVLIVILILAFISLSTD